MKTLALLLIILIASPINSMAVEISDLQKRPYLDDYLNNVVLGHKIINNTKKYAYRYSGNQLNCSNCHLNSGKKKYALPLNVYGMYPKWRDKNGRRNGIGLRIRECFVYSLNGIMPPEDSTEVMALAAYISFISEGEVIGASPEGRGTVVLQDTGYSPNPANGKIVYEKKCLSCHLKDGGGNNNAPALWGLKSYNKGAGMFNDDKLAGWIWKNMPLGNEESLEVQEAKDVAAYINTQIRPGDPRKSKVIKIIEDIINSASKILTFNK